MNTHCIILTSEFPPLTLGGVGRYVSEVASRLCQWMSVTVALVPTYHSPRLPERTASLSGGCHAPPTDLRILVCGVDYQNALLEIDAPQNCGRLLDAAKTVAEQCAAKMRSDETVVVYVQDYALSPIAAALRQRFPMARVLAACHLPVYAGFTYFDKPVGDAIHQVLEAKLVQLAHHVVVPSAFAGHVVTITHNVPRGKLEVIPLGVCRPTPVTPLPKGSLRLIAVGRPTEQKGYHFLFEALQKLKHWHDATRLTVVSGTDFWDRLQMLAKRQGVAEHVDFVGAVEHDKIWQLYDRHHFFVTTSLYETFGLAVLEAMASGRPTVGFSVGALPELWGAALAAELGTHVACVDPLVSRLRTLATMVDKWDALARDVVQRAREFSWARHVERLVGLMLLTSPAQQRP